MFITCPLVPVILYFSLGAIRLLAACDGIVSSSYPVTTWPAIRSQPFQILSTVLCPSSNWSDVVSHVVLVYSLNWLFVNIYFIFKRYIYLIVMLLSTTYFDDMAAQAFS